jgi:hypothetical protein
MHIDDALFLRTYEAAFNCLWIRRYSCAATLSVDDTLDDNVRIPQLARMISAECIDGLPVEQGVTWTLGRVIADDRTMRRLHDEGGDFHSDTHCPYCDRDAIEIAALNGRYLTS